MGQRLRCDLGALERAATSLDALGREFAEAGDLTDDAGSAVGHAGLADRLRHFSEGWQVRREDLLEDMTHLAELTHTAVTTYRDVDDQLAAAVERPAS